MADTNFNTGNSDGGVVADSVVIGGGTRVKQLTVYTVALTPVAVAATTSAEQTFNVAGLAALKAATDIVLEIHKPTAQAGLGIVGARVSADGTLAIRFMNTTAGAITPTAENYTAVVIRT